MKRKRNDSIVSTPVSPTNHLPTKILNLQNGSNVEIQLDDGKWHSGLIIECQTKKYLVQVDQQQYWTDLDLIRTNSLLDQKRTAPFEYRPGQFLRNESKSPTKTVPDEKMSSSLSDSNECSTESKRKRTPRPSLDQKKCPFVWKPSTISTIQTRRSSKNGQISIVSPEDNSIPHRTSNEEKTLPITNVRTSSEQIPSSEVLIFRPIIRFVESTSDDPDQSSKRHSSTDDDEIPLKPLNGQIIDNGCRTSDSRSSSRTSTDNASLIGSYDSQQSKSEGKSSCFLETPPPSLPDIHLTQESESPCEKYPIQQLKSKRKQDRPQRKSLLPPPPPPQPPVQVPPHSNVIVFNHDEDLNKNSPDLCDPGYLSDEYSEPLTSTKDLSTSIDLEKFSQQLIHWERNSSEEMNFFNDDDRRFYEQFIEYICNHEEHYQSLDQYRREYYHDETNPRICLISNILKEIFSIGFNRKDLLRQHFQQIPNEIKTHWRLCLNNVIEEKNSKKKILHRGKRFHSIGTKCRAMKTPRIFPQSSSSITDLQDQQQQQQMLLSPSSPLTPTSNKFTEDLLSPNTTQQQQHLIPPDGIEELTVLPKERDVYEIIHCLCQCQIDNGFMIQCETCLCWSHCECVGVTATCIPAFFKCNICSKAEADRTDQCLSSTLFDEDLTSLFVLTPTNGEKISRLLSYSKRLWNLREQMIELKLRSTPQLRALEYAFRSDDLMELSKYSIIQSDQLMRKIDQRRINREHFQTIAHTINDIIDDVCQDSSSCQSIQLRNDRRISRSISDSIEVLIHHLCDDRETREIRQMIEHRYQQLIDNVDQKIQRILNEHQNVAKEMEIECGISVNDLSNDHFSYETHQIALRTALERLKS